jgi:putative flippase GtrA
MAASDGAPPRGRRHLTKLLRYGAASVITTVISLALLGVLLFATTPGWANLVAVAVGSVLSFELNRRWVWQRSDRKGRWVQLLLFICASLVFLVVSTLAVREVSSALGPRSGSTLRALAVETTTVAVFGVRWAMQYVFLARVLFRTSESVVPTQS